MKVLATVLYLLPLTFISYWYLTNRNVANGDVVNITLLLMLGFFAEVVFGSNTMKSQYTQRLRGAQLYWGFSAFSGVVVVTVAYETGLMVSIALCGLAITCVSLYGLQLTHLRRVKNQSLASE